MHVKTNMHMTMSDTMTITTTIVITNRFFRDHEKTSKISGLLYILAILVKLSYHCHCEKL